MSDKQFQQSKFKIPESLYEALQLAAEQAKHKSMTQLLKKNMQLINSFRVKPCPFCGLQITEDDLDDCLHPMREGIWQMSCLELGGGCGVTMYGDDENDVVSKWNRRIIY